MRLDRNTKSNGEGKYALLKLRDSPVLLLGGHEQGFEATIVKSDSIDYGSTTDTDFFVIRLRDKYAAPALAAYAMAAWRDDPEYAKEVLELSKQAAEHPRQQQPS